MGNVKINAVPTFGKAERNSWFCNYHKAWHPDSVQQFMRQGFVICEAGAVRDYLGYRITDAASAPRSS